MRNSDQELFKPRSTASEIYDFIESDLQDAATILPVKGNERIEGSVTSGAALGLLAKTYLYQEKWSQTTPMKLE